MKTMLMIIALCFGASYAQSPTFSVDTAYADCHQGMVHSTVQNTGVPTNGFFYLNYLDNDDNWTSSGVTWGSTGETGNIDMTFSGIGQLIHDYDSLEINYYDSGTNDTILVTRLNSNCATFGINDVNDNITIIKTEYYNLSGQFIKEVVSAGIYVRIDYYDNGRTKRSKVYEKGWQ